MIPTAAVLKHLFKQVRKSESKDDTSAVFRLWLSNQHRESCADGDDDGKSRNKEWNPTFPT